MGSFKDRLLEEKINLDNKITKLDEFINSTNFSSLDSVQMTLLNIQLKIMESYSQVLLERIARLD